MTRIFSTIFAKSFILFVCRLGYKAFSGISDCNTTDTGHKISDRLTIEKTAASHQCKWKTEDWAWVAFCEKTNLLESIAQVKCKFPIKAFAKESTIW